VDRHAYYRYQILDHVEQTPRLTNRMMARKLGVSVNLAHELLTGLAKRGLFHIRKRHARRWDYYLTPKGITEKMRLAYEFLGFSMQFYREARRRSAAVLRKAHEEGVKRVALLGATELAEIASLGMREWQLELVDIFDEARAGERLLGMRVRPLDEVAASNAERILVTAFDPEEPMGRRYVPRGVRDDGRLMWIFDVPEGAADAPVQGEAP
jgi:predicted transcriptional regulator